MMLNPTQVQKEQRQNRYVNVLMLFHGLHSGVFQVQLAIGSDS